MPITMPGVVGGAHKFNPLDNGAGGGDGSLLTALWWNATVAAQITDAGSGHTSDWTEYHGSPNPALGFVLSQGTDARRPITGTRTQNSLNVLDFDGTDDRLIGGGAFNTFTLAQPFTVYIVCLSDDGADSTRQVMFDRITTTGITIEKTAANVWAMNAGTALASATAPTTAAQYFTATFNGASSVLRRNGTQIASGNAGTNGFSGNSFAIGYATGATAFWDGWIGEVILSGAADSAGVVAQMETYLSTKWNI